MTLKKDKPHQKMGGDGKSVAEMSLEERRERDKLNGHSSYWERQDIENFLRQLKRFGFKKVEDSSVENTDTQLYVNDFSYPKSENPLQPDGKACDIAITDGSSAIVFSLSRFNSGSKWTLTVNCATNDLQDQIYSFDSNDRNYIRNIGLSLDSERLALKTLKNFGLEYDKSEALKELEEQEKMRPRAPLAIAKQSSNGQGRQR